MATITDTQIAFASRLAERVVHSPDMRDFLWNLTGSVGSGKTSVLQLARDRLWEMNMIPLLVTAPGIEVDVGPIALLEVADQLKAVDLLNGEANAINDPRVRWPDKMAAITGAIARNHASVVILCDEPTRWCSTPQPSYEDSPEYAARQFADWITLKAPCRRIVSGWITEDVLSKRVRVPLLDDGRAILADSKIWCSVTSLADSLNSEMTHGLSGRSPGQMKLYVALVRFLKPDKVAERAMLDTSVTSVPELIEDVLDLVEGEEHRLLRDGLKHLAMSRTFLPPQVFDSLTDGLTQLDRDLIRCCLCVREGDGIALHPLLRSKVINRARDRQRPEKNRLWRLNFEERKRTHKKLQQVFSTESVGSFRSQLEELHHDLLGGDGLPSVSDHRILFVEQLHELGRSLSYFFHDHRRAADLFRLALEFDPDHPYSHHYLAFNLDWLAEETQNVECHYQKAIELQPTHPWWWSRWLSYLATRGRFRQARSVWIDAVNAMSVDEEGTPEWIYLSLHRWVARWLLHWAELDFAETVLRSIPTELAERDGSIQVLWNLLRALRIAELGPAVFPLSVPVKEWWSANGHTGLPLTIKDQPLHRWLPARVESVDTQGDRLMLVVADRPADHNSPLEYRDCESSRAEVEHAALGFTWTDLREGRFLELAYYGAQHSLRIGLHRSTEFRDPQLIPLVPPPDRWFRHAVEAAWESTEDIS